MRLLAHLLVRIAAVVLLCLAVTIAWILIGTHRDIGRATEASAARAAQHLQALYWQELLWRNGIDRVQILPEPEWETLATARIVAPGTCVAFTPRAGVPRRLCSASEGIYAPAPAWFAALYDGLFGTFPDIVRPLDARLKAGRVTASVDTETAVRLAWQQIGLMVGTASIMAAGIGLLVALVVAHTLMPVRTIIEGLGRLEAGDYAHRIARRGRADLGRIAGAVNALAGRLGEVQAARAALTRQLYHVQEEERRALARDLHDEFGQCLAATNALAGSIEAGASDRPDLADDARAIGAAAKRMMRTLKEALVRLRSQDIDELGLDACFRNLVASWNGRAGGHVVAFEADGDLADVPRPVAIGLYRIAQECLTNAARHGGARNVTLRVAALRDGVESVALTVEDDGGGDPARLDMGTGHGLPGIRERIAALGGSLAIGRAAAGIRVAATLPFEPTEHGALPAAA